MEIIRYPSVDSTNSILMEMSKKSAKSWTVVWTSHQTAGRGYAGNPWKIKKDENIALSLLIKSNLNYSDLIYFNQWLANAVAKVLCQFSTEVAVKWPNDIVMNEKKLCGILIETHKADNQLNIIAGIGLNVNQKDFDGLPNASSMAREIGRDFDLNEILSALLTELENTYFLVEQRAWDQIGQTYHEQLFRWNEWHSFQNASGIFLGKIKGVNLHGQLEVLLENETLVAFNHKEIEFIY